VNIQACIEKLKERITKYSLKKLIEAQYKIEIEIVK
jgi:hypothetical protein